MRCDECGSDEITEDEFRRKPRYTCRCGHQWGQGDSKRDSTCTNCGNYQHEAARKKFWTGVIGCWYCGQKRKK